MKKIQTPVLILILLVVGLISYIIYDKFSFTEEMAKDSAQKVFNLLMVKGHEGFQEVYPTLNNGSRIVTNKLCSINSVTKRDDGNYEVFASYEPNKFKVYPISIVVNRQGKVISSRGISYAYFDKTLDYGKKLGCLSGDESDVEMERIITEKKLRDKLEKETELAISSIYFSLEDKGTIEQNYGVTAGNVVITNNSPYNLEYGDVSCKVNYYNSRGEVVETNDLLITELDAYSSKSCYAYGSSSSAVKYKIVKNVFSTEGLKSRVKDKIVRNTQNGCL